MDPKQQPENPVTPSDNPPFINYREKVPSPVPAESAPALPPLSKNLPPFKPVVAVPPKMPMTPTSVPAPAPVPTPVPVPQVQPPIPSKNILAQAPAEPMNTMPPRMSPSSSSPLSPQPPAAFSSMSYMPSTMPPHNLPNAFVPPSSAVPRRPHSKKWLGIFLLVLVILAAGAYAAYAFVLNPQKTVSGAIVGLDSAKYIHATTQISLDTDIKQISGSSLTVISDLDRSNLDMVKTQAAIDFENSNLSIAIDTKVIDGKVYLRFRNVPDSALATISALKLGSTTDSSVLKNLWFSLSLDNLNKFADLYNFSPTSLTSITGNSGISLSSGYESLKKAGVFTEPAFGGVKNVNGSFVRVYTVTINKELLADMIASRIVEAASSSLPATKITETRLLITNYLNMLTISPITIYTSLLSGTLKGLEADLTVSSISMISASPITIHFRSTYDDQLFTAVNAPDSFIPADSLINQSYEKYRATQSKMTDSAIQSQVSSIRSAMENYLATARNFKYTGGCSQASVVAILADMNKSGSAAICRESPDAYLIAATLTATSSQAKPVYYCLDSLGGRGTFAKLPTGYRCK